MIEAEARTETPPVTELDGRERVAVELFRHGGPLVEIARILGASPDAANVFLDSLQLRPARPRTCANARPRTPSARQPRALQRSARCNGDEEPDFESDEDF